MTYKILRNRADELDVEIHIDGGIVFDNKIRNYSKRALEALVLGYRSIAKGRNIEVTDQYTTD